MFKNRLLLQFSSSALKLLNEVNMVRIYKKLVSDNSADGKMEIRTKKKKLVNKKKIEEESKEESISDVECLYCGYKYPQSDEGWVTCMICSKWAYCSCAGEADDDAKERS